MMHQLETELREKNVNIDNLGIVVYGDENVFGELIQIDPKLPIAGYPVGVKDPKRFLRVQYQDKKTNTMFIDFVLGDLDLIDSGVITVVPTMGYLLVKQSVECRIEFYKLYLAYLDRKIKANFVAAGGVLPDTGIIGAR